MKKKMRLEGDYEFFVTEKIEESVLVRFRGDLLNRATGLQAKETVLGYFDLLSEAEDVKVVIILGALEKAGCDGYLRFYKQIYESNTELGAIRRMYHAIDQFILKIVGMDKLVIHADSGEVISMFLNISLACDYRIVSEDTRFMNPCVGLGLVPKGGGAFFLSRQLGRGKALDLLLSEESISAEKALALGLVDRVVPVGDVKREALEMARLYTSKPAPTVAGVKSLLQFSVRELEAYLELENRVLSTIVSSTDFKSRLDQCA